MASNKGDAPKKGVDLAKLLGNGGASEHLREQMERNGVLTGMSASERFRKETDYLDALAGSSRAVQKALAPSAAVQKMMKTHDAAFDVARAFSSVSAFSGIASVIDPIRISTFREAQDRLHASLGLGFRQSDSVTRMLDSLRAGQSAIQSALSSYMDQHRAQAERISSMVDALAIPRVNPATFSIGSALALSETNAFKIAGLTPDYTEEFRSITDAVSERIGAFAGLASTNKAFALQPDLVGRISTLLERALAQQEALLEQQREPVAETQPRQQTLLAERLTIIAAIVAILYTMLCVYVMFEERLAGGDAATLANTVAIEENTQALEKMRGSFDAIADQLEQMSAAQEDAKDNKMTADAAIAEILREISSTLMEQENRQEGDPDQSPSDGSS